MKDISFILDKPIYLDKVLYDEFVIGADDENGNCYLDLLNTYPNIDSDALHITLTLEEAEVVLFALNKSIEEFKSKNK